MSPNKLKSLVSIVMITYNHEEYIKEAIDGVLMQESGDAFDIELIIADDCSPDRTEEIVRKYITDHPRGNWIKYHRHHQNIGMMPNFVFALKEAKGKYIALCEGDDYWIDDTKLYKQFKFLESNTDFNLIFHEVKLRRNLSFEPDDITSFKIKKLEYTRDELLIGNFIHTPTVMFRNKFTIPNWYIKAIPGDYFLYILVTTQNKKIARFNEIMSVYRIHEGGIWSMTNRGKFQTRVNMSFINCARHQKIKNIIFFENHLIDLYKQQYWDTLDYVYYNKLDYLKTIFYIMNIDGLKFKYLKLFFPKLNRLFSKIYQKTLQIYK